MRMFAALSGITLALQVKQLILHAPGMQLPPRYNEIFQTENTTSWWDFESVDAVLPDDDAHPDVVATLKDGSKLFIEIAHGSLIDKERFERIQAVGLNTIGIDLSYIYQLNPDIKPEDLKGLILHNANIKTWIYPDYILTSPFHSRRID